MSDVTQSEETGDFGPGLMMPDGPDSSPDYAEGGQPGAGKSEGQGQTEGGGHPPAKTSSKNGNGSNTWTGDELERKTTDQIPLQLDEVKRTLEEKAGLGSSFDLVLREMKFGERGAAFFYANGFAKDYVLTEVISRLTLLGPEELEQQPIAELMDRFVAHIQVDKADSLNDVVNKVLAGATAMFIEGESTAILVDAKNFPVRSIDEPDLERVIRGSRDGFVETLLTNVSLVRRRLRDPRLKLEIVQIGARTKTDVCIGYIQDIADPELVESIRDKLANIQVDGLPLADKQLEEAMIGKGWNPYPLVRYSERPDVASAHMLEGHVVLFVDTSPSVMILPTTFFHLVQHAEEYRQAPFLGTYIRWVRYSGMLASIFLLPLWYLLVAHPELKPAGLEWLGPQKNGHLPILLQFLLAELGVDLMRLAAVHTPTPLATAMGLVAAILIGDIAVKTGLFVNEVILYLAVATIGMFATPSYELSMANRITRLVLLLATALFGVPGFVLSTTAWILLLALQRSYNSPYLWPFIPFDVKALFSVAIRKPFMANKRRMTITKPIDNTRQPT